MENDLFSKTLKEKRLEAGYSQAELSELLYITRASYNHFETGKRTPTIHTLLRMSSIFNINPMELLCPLIPEDIEEENPAYAGFLKNIDYSPLEKDLQFLTNYQQLNNSQKCTINNLVHILNSSHLVDIK